MMDLKRKCEKEYEMAPPAWLCRAQGERKRIHLAGLGDVGCTLLVGLLLTAGDIVETVGVYDVNEPKKRRMEMELNQMSAPFGPMRIPSVYMAEQEDLFCCDVFIFCVAKAIPPVGAKQGDVRMAQFDVNRKIVSWYAKKAAEAHFKGLFLVVSDPVEPLCKAALLAANEGTYHMFPNQIQGCGLGVMYGRACYYAAHDKRFEDFLSNGRVFGAHGKDLVVANSLSEECYDDERSAGLTDLVVHANLKVRETGFKPYLAPAVSSGVITIVNILKGRWNYSSNYLGGVYFGAKNRTAENGVEWELQPLPDKLFRRLQNSYHNLEMIL